MNTNQKLIDAVRTVGQLLLHRPTTGELAKNSEGKTVSPCNPEASCFCYIGACRAVAPKFGFVNSTPFSDNSKFAVERACDTIIGRLVDGSDWDNASPRTRKRWATKLANYTGE